MANGTRVVFADIQAYLDAIADHPGTRPVEGASHDRFWRIPYSDFIDSTKGIVPNIQCQGAPIPIVDKDPSKCPLLQALTTPLGWCNKRQMPRGGPFVTATGYSATLQDGTVVTGTKIVDDITWWLTHGMPEQ